MAEIRPMTDEERTEWLRWVAERPPRVRAVAERVWPNRLYRINSGHRVILYSFGEPTEANAPVTVTVAVLGTYNLVEFERRVFGIEPDELVECDLPDPTEALGVLLTEDETARYCAWVRAQGGPAGPATGAFQWWLLGQPAA